MKPLRYPGGVTVYKGARGHRVVRRGENGEREQAQRASLDDACALAVEWSRAAASVEDAGSDATLAEVAREWLMVLENADGRSRSYVSGQRKNLDLWVLPHLGGPVRLLTRGQLASTAGNIRDNVKSDGYAAQLLGTLTRLWKYAVQAGYVPTERAEWGTLAARGRRLQGHSREFVDPSQRPDTDSVLRLIEACDDYRLRASVTLAAFCGLRWGETAALERDDVDLDEYVVRVQRQVKYVDGVRDIDLPKGRKVRDTVLPEFAVDFLSKALDAADPLVCPAGDGEHDTPQAFHRRFTKAREAAGWPAGWTFHSLRHHFATWLLGKSVPVEDVAMMLGHSSPDVTWRTYVGVAEGALGRAREATRSL